MKFIRKSFLIIIILCALPSSLCAQSLISIDPGTAQTGQGLGIGIYGQGTHFNQAGSMSVWFSHGSSIIYGSGYYPVNDTFMVVWFDITLGAELGLYDLNVYNDIDGTLTLDDCFIITPGAIAVVSVGPDSAQQGQTLTLAVSGRGTHFEQGDGTTVWFSQGSGIIAANVWPVSNVLLLAQFIIPEDAATGLQYVSVYNDIDGTLTLPNSFTITPYNPRLISVTPGAAYQGQKLSVRISGQNTTFEQGSGAFAWFSQGSSFIFPGQTAVIAGERMEVADFNIPVDAATGMWNVHTFSETDGHLTLVDGFLITRPGDLTCDGSVNFFDLAVIADSWLEGTNP
jgi:hypothetical protein